jgi:hypothetical protein
VSLGADVPVKRLTGAKEFITVTVTAGQRAGSVSDGASQPSTSPSATTGPASRSATGPASQPATAPAQKVHVLKLAKVDGKAYVWLEGVAVRALGEIPSSTYDDFAADFRGLDIWTIDPADVQSIKITSAKPSGPQTGTLELVKGQQEWQYPADQFVKVDAAKVKGFLESIKQVQAQRFMPQSDYWLLGTWASHSQPATKPATSTQPADYGLATPETVLELGCKDGAKVLTISKKGPDSNGRYASASDIGGVFVVADELVSKVSKNLDDFKK